MKIVVTGGIGSGKSAVVSVLSDHMRDYYVASIDQIVKDLHQRDDIKEALGVFGGMDKTELSNICFESPTVLQKVESVINPAIEEALENVLKLQNVIVEFPLFFREDIHKKWGNRFDLAIGVTADDDERIRRVMSRNEFDEAKVLRIMSKQPDQQQIDTECDIVFENNLRPLEIPTAVQLHLLPVIARKEREHLAVNESKAILSKINAPRKGKIGIVSGSFDPIQYGHLYVIEKALAIVDTVHVVLGYNDKKQSFLDMGQKMAAIRESIVEKLGTDAMARCRTGFLAKDELLLTYAKRIDAQLIFRGLRSGFDFDYEQSINAVQRDLDETIETVYIMTPAKYTQVSSSMVRSLSRYKEALPALEKYVTKAVLKILEDKREL